MRFEADTITWFCFCQSQHTRVQEPRAEVGWVLPILHPTRSSADLGPQGENTLATDTSAFTELKGDTAASPFWARRALNQKPEKGQLWWPEWPVRSLRGHCFAATREGDQHVWEAGDPQLCFRLP